MPTIISNQYVLFIFKVKVLGTINKTDKSNEPIVVAVQQDNIVATSFHPELTEDLTWHQHFLHVVASTVAN